MHEKKAKIKAELKPNPGLAPLTKIIAAFLVKKSPERYFFS